MRIIPKKTNVSMEFFNGFTSGDVAVGFVGAVIEVAILVSNLPGKYYIMAGALMAVALLLLKLDDERNYIFLLNILRHYAYRIKYVKDLPEKKRGACKQKKEDIRKVIAYTGIEDGLILYDKKYYGAVLELDSVEFRFFSEFRQDNAIEKALGGVLRNVNPNYAANLVKIERPIIYDEFVRAEHEKIESLKDAYRRGILSEEELQRRIEIIYDRIEELNSLSFDNKVILPFFYLVLFDSDRNLLNNQVGTALELLGSGELPVHRLDDKELAVFMKYTQSLDFDERDFDQLEPEEYYEYSLPEQLDIYAKNMVVNGILTHNFRVVNYPMTVTNAWGAFVFDTPATKVVMKMKPMDRTKSIRAIDRSIDELRSQENSTGKASKLIDISTHIDTLSELLMMLQSDNEILMDVNIYVTGYDLESTMADSRVAMKPENSALPNIANLKKSVRRVYNDSNMKLNDMLFLQMDAWIAGQVSGYDPREGKGRSIHSSSVAAVFPFVYTYTADEGGIRLGKKNGVPVFIDFFRRDNERVNSNMAIIGKSGSGKSYATKTLLANLAAENSKIFVLDPENEYMELAQNLGGKIINVGNATHGRMNPFQIITNLEDDEEGEEEVSGVSFHTHLQFLEEFFKQILPDIEPDALEYLNNLIIRIYSMKGIEEHTDLSRLKPEDYPIFDDLYDTILEEFQSTKSDYLKGNLQILINYIAKFSSGGRNSVLWNGYSTINTEENFIVFNFQSLLANRNNLIANAQMLLVLKWLDNEIIKNRDYNKKYHAARKIVVVIDEAHVFIDTKYPLALDFMFQLAKRIRKYNGMQIVITQNIKDFVGSEEIARKSTAIINACQYSLIFALAPNDMHDLCRLYEKAGQINEQEQEEIINASRGQAFVITSPTNRSSLQIEAGETVQSLFTENEFISPYFTSPEGEVGWRTLVAHLDSEREESVFLSMEELEQQLDAREYEENSSGAIENKALKRVKIVEISEEEIMAQQPEEKVEKQVERQPLQERSEEYHMPLPGEGYSPERLLDSRKFMDELRNSLRKELLEELKSSLAMEMAQGNISSPFGNRNGMPGQFAAQNSYGQPGMPEAPGYGDPGMPGAPGYGEPGMAGAPGYGEPGMAGAPGYGEPGMAGAPGYGEPGMPGMSGEMLGANGYHQSGMPGADGYVQRNGTSMDGGLEAENTTAGYEEEDWSSGEWANHMGASDAQPDFEEQEAMQLEEEFYQMFGMIEVDKQLGLIDETPEELEERILEGLGEGEEEPEEDTEASFISFFDTLFQEAQEVLEDTGEGMEEEISEESEDVLVWEITYEQLTA